MAAMAKANVYKECATAFLACIVTIVLANAAQMIALAKATVTYTLVSASAGRDMLATTAL